MGRSDRAEGDRRRDRRAEAFRRHHRAGRRHRRRAGDDRRQASLRAVRRRDRERLPQVLRRNSATRAEMRLGRHRAGAGRGRDQDRDRRARGPGRAAVGQAAARRSSKIPNFKDGVELLSRPVRQFLRRQFLPDLRHQFHRARKSWARPRRTSKRCRSSLGAAGEASPAAPAFGGKTMDIAAVPLFRMEGVSKRYGGVRALEKADLTSRPAASTPFSARTARASRR